MLSYLRKMKQMIRPTWSIEAPDSGNNLESMFKLTWNKLSRFAHDISKGMAFLEEQQVTTLSES